MAHMEMDIDNAAGICAYQNTIDTFLDPDGLTNSPFYDSIFDLDEEGDDFC